jgi:hypothetical protein
MREKYIDRDAGIGPKLREFYNEKKPADGLLSLLGESDHAWEKLWNGEYHGVQFGAVTLHFLADLRNNFSTKLRYGVGEFMTSSFITSYVAVSLLILFLLTILFLLVSLPILQILSYIC